MTDRPFFFGRADETVDHVIDVAKIPQLFSLGRVETAVPQASFDNLRNETPIVLAGAVHEKETRDHGRKILGLGEHLQQMGRRDFANGIGRDRVFAQIFALGRRRVAVFVARADLHE